MVKNDKISFVCPILFFFCVLKQGGQGLLACRVKQILLAPLLFHFAFKKSLKTKAQSTVFENRQKSRIQHCERSELRLHFEWTKVG